VHTAKELDFDHIYIYVVGLAQTFIRAKPSSVDRLTSNCLLMRVPEVNSSMNTFLAVPQDRKLKVSARACDVSQENADAYALAFHDGAGACAVPPLAPRARVHVYDEHHECADARAL
jgi:hypothetical protein